MAALEGNVAVVMGGTSGIGARTAEAFTAAGARVVIAGRREERGNQLATELGNHASFVRADVRMEADVQAAIAHAVDRHGRLDCLVNSAGAGGSPGGVAGIDLARLQDTMAVHVGGVVAAIKHAAPVMTTRGSGSIINVASIGGRLGGWTFLDYAAAKAAVLQVTRSAAVELAESGVRVNSISPGPVLTGIFGKAAGLDPTHADRTAAALEPLFNARLELWQPTRRAGLPSDVAPVAVWLASDASGFVTGQDIAVDGGITAGRPAAVAAEDRAEMAATLAGC